MRMSEIGSEFWDVPTSQYNNTVFSKSTQWYISGRSALKAIVDQLDGVGSVSLPAWCCDSMVKPFTDAGIDVKFYPVYFDGSLFSEFDYNSDALFLIDYFGYIGQHPDLNAYKGIIIRDVTHSIFSTNYSDADYYFGSLRKWCGMWTGGFAWTRDGSKLAEGVQDTQGYAKLREMAMRQKETYILGPDGTNKDYLGVFDKAEKCLENMGVVQAEIRDVRAAQKLDVDMIRKRRIANAKVLRSAFFDWLVFPKLSANDCPLFVPILVPNGKRDGLRRHLIDQRIYCPVHWPMDSCRNYDERTVFLYRNELSLVCDQRYTEDDMYRMVGVIQQFMEG